MLLFNGFIMRCRLQLVLAFPLVALVMAVYLLCVSFNRHEKRWSLTTWMDVGERCERYCLTAYQ
jgi:hypothetical protein